MTIGNSNAFSLANGTPNPRERSTGALQSVLRVGGDLLSVDSAALAFVFDAALRCACVVANTRPRSAVQRLRAVVGLRINGHQMLGENISDFGSVQMAFDGLQLALQSGAGQHRLDAHARCVTTGYATDPE